MYFIHIPKCGGSTIRNCIAAALASADSRSDPRKVIYAYGDDKGMGDFSISFADLKGFAATISPSQVKAIIGHYTYSSLSSYLGHSNTYGQAFTIVRDPIERLMSAINYARAKHDHPHHKYFSDIGPERLYEHLASIGGRWAGSYMLDFLDLCDAETDDNKESIQNQVRRIDTILSRVNVYKISSSAAAIRSHISSKASERINISNRTSEWARATQDKNSLYNLSMLNSRQKARLREIYWADYLLWDAAT